MKKKKSVSRIVSAVLALLTLAVIVLSVSSCGGCGGSAKVDYNITESDKTLFDAGAERASAMYVARIVNAAPKFGNYSWTARERLIAAYRGYNMDAEGFVDRPEYAEETRDPLVDVAKSVILSVKDQYVTDEVSQNRITAYANELDEAALRVLVENCMAHEVNLKANNGVIDTVLLWIGKFMNWLTGITGGYYVISILIFAILVKLLFIYPSIKQQKSQIKMAKLRPKIYEIEQKYAGRNDQKTLQKKQQEIMELQQREGASPLSGCLPLLIQLPIIILLYNIITNPLRYVLGLSGDITTALTTFVTTASAAGGFGQAVTSTSTIEILSRLGDSIPETLKAFPLFSNSAEVYELVKGVSIPDFSFFGLGNLGVSPSLTNFSWLVVIPVLTAAFQWLSMFLMKKWNGSAQTTAGDAQTAASMKMMDLIFPLLTLWMAFNFPAMLGLYWIYQSLIGLLQSWILNKAMPLPKYTDEELRAMQKAEKAKAKQQSKVVKQQPKYKSLHYIDEDDYDELPDVKKNDTGAKAPKNLDVPELKDDRRS